MTAYRKVPEDLLAETVRDIDSARQLLGTFADEAERDAMPVLAKQARSGAGALAALMPRLQPIHEGDGVPDGWREAAAAILRRFHRNSCYPEALPGEVDTAITALGDAQAASPRPEPRKEAESATPVQDKPCGTCGSVRGYWAWTKTQPAAPIWRQCPDCKAMVPKEPGNDSTGRASSPASAGEVEDRWYPLRPQGLKAISGDVEDGHVLRVHFDHDVTGADRDALAAAFHQAALTPAVPPDSGEETVGDSSRVSVRTCPCCHTNHQEGPCPYFHPSQQLRTPGWRDCVPCEGTGSVPDARPTPPVADDAVERAAQEIFKEEQAQRYPCSVEWRHSWPKAPGVDKERCRALARAALSTSKPAEAMRERT